MTYYNDNDPKICAWLRELMKQGHVSEGIIDDRNITALRGADLAGYSRVHLFAGIAGWDYTLTLAGWPDNVPVWTGSCPCQPFSCAGKRAGTDDPRHLWPEFLRLITECQPATIFGEQVAGTAGREWLSGVRVDLETLGYAVGAADLCAASVGAPHIRQRLYWLAESANDNRWPGKCGEEKGVGSDGERWRGFASRGPLCGLADSERNDGRTDLPKRGQTRREVDLRDCPWSSYRTVKCADGASRRIPTESAFLPLAHGIPARMVRLRGYGNSIVPQVAAEFVKAYMEICGVQAELQERAL